MQLRNELSRELPGVEISAEHYPPGATQQMLSSLISVAQWAVIIGALSGQSGIDAVSGTPLAAPLAHVQENKMAMVGISWFMGSSISASLLKTGAFEVQVRSTEDSGKERATLWSGIEHGGRPPMTVQEMFEIRDTLLSTLKRGESKSEELESPRLEEVD